MRQLNRVRIQYVCFCVVKEFSVQWTHADIRRGFNVRLFWVSKSCASVTFDSKYDNGKDWKWNERTVRHNSLRHKSTQVASEVNILQFKLVRERLNGHLISVLPFHVGCLYSRSEGNWELSSQSKRETLIFDPFWCKLENRLAIKQSWLNWKWCEKSLSYTTLPTVDLTQLNPAWM